jgi:hypothetical protein
MEAIFNNQVTCLIGGSPLTPTCMKKNIATLLLLILERKTLMRQKKALMKEYRRLSEQFDDMVFPFDFSGEEPTDDEFWKIAEYLIQNGYLTKDIKPTSLALKKDYIRFNDGSKFYDGLEKQPELLFTAKFLLLIGNDLSNLNLN